MKHTSVADFSYFYKDMTDETKVLFNRTGQKVSSAPLSCSAPQLTPVTAGYFASLST